MTTEKKKYHDKTTAHKDVQHPHSKLKTQKELRKITDSKEFKEAGYHDANKMLAEAHPTTMKKGGRVKRKNTRRENRLEELGRVDAEKAYSRKGKRNLKSEKRRIVRELKSTGGSVKSRGAATHGFGKEIR
tara:strand:- start:308 stop:700 length:393 start_codon:yes stop_codon:yes gene_type:complete